MAAETADPIESFREKYEEKADHPNKDPDAVRQTAETHARYLGLFRDWLAERDKDLFDDLSVREIRKFRLWLADEHNYSEGTIRNATGSLSQFFQVERPEDPNPVRQWSEASESGTWSYTTDKKRESREDVVYLSEDQVERLIEAADGFRSTLIIRLLVSTGIRVSELVTLRCQDVSPEDREISIHARKTDDYRDIGFRSRQLARDLRVWLDHKRTQERGAAETDYLFPAGQAGAKNDHLSVDTVQATVRDAAEAADVQDTYATDSEGRVRHKVTPHVLRATFAVHAAKAGVSAPVIQETLGHHDLSVTQLYADVAAEDAADVIREQGPQY